MATDQAHFRPSWQVRIFCLFCRFVMKPLMSLSSIKMMRWMTALFESGKPKPLPDGLSTTAISTGWQGSFITNINARHNRVILYFPGGGFVVRTPQAHTALLARLCDASEANGLLVLYKLAPENPYPAGFEDCLSAYHYLLEQGYGPDDVTIAGDSAGGNMVLSVLMNLRDHGLPLPANGVMLSPLLDLTFSGKSRTTNARRDPMLPNGGQDMMKKIYHPSAESTDPYISPLFGRYEGLPPILCQVGDIEILLDDSVRAVESAREAGAPFYLEIWKGLPHVWQVLTFAPEASLAIERISKFVRQGTLTEPNLPVLDYVYPQRIEPSLKTD